MRIRGIEKTRTSLRAAKHREMAGFLWFAKPFIFFAAVVAIMACVAYALGWWSPGNPKMRPDGVLEFSTPFMGSYHCTSAGAHYDGWPTGQPCVIRSSR